MSSKGSRRPVKVAFCLDSFEIGGTELNAVRTAEAFDPNRVELSVFHLQTKGPLRERYEKLGVLMTHIPIPNLYSSTTLQQGMSLGKQLRERRVDVVHSHDIYCNIFAVPWARILSRSAVIASRRWWYEAPRPELLGLNRLASHFAHRVLANSSGVAKLLANEERVSRSKIVEVPNFLSQHAFENVGAEKRMAQRRAWGVPDEVFAIGIVARLSPVKNHTLLLQAVKLLPDRFHVVIVGGGPSLGALVEEAKLLRIEARVHFVGEIISQVNLHQYFDVSVLCSNSEGFPNSLIEAMAASRAVVATPVGGVLDAISDGNSGILVQLGKPDALANAITKIEADSALRSRLGSTGCEFVRKTFGQQSVIERLTFVYEQLAGMGTTTTPSQDNA